MTTTRARVLATIGIAVAIGAGASAAGAWSDNDRLSTASESAIPPAKPAPSECPSIAGAVDLGPEFDGLARREWRGCEDERFVPTEAAPSATSNMDVAAYGVCESTASEGGCAPPIQVQTFNACDRNLSLYSKYPGPEGPREYKKLTVRNAPAALFDDGAAAMLEIYTGPITIVVFAESDERALDAANRLRGHEGDESVAPGQRLPAPAAGALNGTLAC